MQTDAALCFFDGADLRRVSPTNPLPTTSVTPPTPVATLSLTPHTATYSATSGPLALSALTWSPALPSVIRSVSARAPSTNGSPVYLGRLGGALDEGVEILPGKNGGFDAGADALTLSAIQIRGSGTDTTQLIVLGGTP